MSEKQQRLFDNEDAYYKASKPFETREQANEAISGFYNEVYELRNKYGIANVSIVIKDTIAGTGGAMSCAFFGNSIENEAMMAYGYGQAVKERQSVIAAMIDEDAITKNTRRK